MIPLRRSSFRSSARSAMRKNSGGRRKPGTSRGGVSSTLEVTEDSEGSEYEVEGGAEAGVRYITESLVQKVGRQESLALVTSLNLSLAKDGGKKFKFIENLEKCEKLEVLNLSHNLIQKMEKLEKLTRLRELNLAHNRISKIEGVEHLQSLQKLNLAGNEIEHIPVWLGKKMKALSTLNLGHNKIFSLHDGSRLKPLRDLTSLCLEGNPVADLPQYRLCTIFHLRSLSSLDGQPITNQERHEAHDRFNLEEVERLERELEKRNREMEELQGQKGKVLSELQHQGELNTSLRLEVQQQKKSCKELEREMDTKNELLKQKTLELTRACQKQYELEQELAFYKIDAKFEPLGYVTSEEVDAEEAPEESPYIGKARYKRNLYTQEGFIPQEARLSQEGRSQRDRDHQIRNQQIGARILTTLHIDLTEKEKHLHTAETKLAELQSEILRASGELKELEDAVAQRKMSEAEKDGIRQRLRDKIQLLDELRREAQELEREMDAQRREMDRKVAELEELQKHLDSLSPSDPRQAHARAQKTSKEQQLEMMDRQYRQLEGRLDDMLSRIARETEEIKDLEQQLTEGQIAANEALKRDLEGIISGLQEYLESVKDEARRAQQECRELQAERPPLLHRLKELEEQRQRLEGAAQEAEAMRKELQEVERSLQEQQELNASLQQAQGDLSAYEDQLEERLRAQEAEMAQLTQELERRKQQGQVETSVLRSELENALSKGRLLEESAQENKRLRSELQQLQRENESLGKRVKKAEARLDESLQNMVHPDHITSRVSELKRKLQTGVGEMRPSGPSDLLGKNLAELQQQVREILGKAEEEKRECRGRQSRLQEEMAALQERATEIPGVYKRACDQAAEARVQQERRQGEAGVRRLEMEVQRLNDQLRTMEEIQGLADQQLVEADEEREKLLAVLHDLHNERRSEDARAQQQLSGLGQELKELKRAVAMSDKMATSELTDTKEQLSSLHGTVLQINRERAEEMEEAESFCAQAARAARDLAKAEAEIELLQELLQEKERQLREPNADPGAADSQQPEMERLRQTLRRQRGEIQRLRHELDHLRADNGGEMDDLLEKIGSLRSALGHQHDDITSVAAPFRRRGYWYFLPPSSNNSGRDSLSTKDSGVSVHCPMTSSPARRKSGLLTPASGRWVYSPFHHAQHRHHRDDDIDGASQSDSDSPPCHIAPPPGSVIYTVFPDGSPAPQGTVIYGPPPPSPGRAVAPGTVIYGPPPQGAPLVYGPPPAHFTLPLIPAGVLHCNVSAHHQLENEVSRLEDIIDHLKCVRRREKKSSRMRLAGDIEELECRKEIYRKEVEELRNAVQRHKRRNLQEGHLDALITELELERSLQDHHHLEDEIQCVEKTLLKRRAELREAERLLAEADGDLKSTQGKTAELVEKYNMAKKRLCQTESDAEELESRAQDTALHLINAEQQLRVLQAEGRELEQRRAEQENVLQEISSVVSTKAGEFQSLSLKVQSLSDSLQTLQGDIQEAEGREDHRLKTLREAESLLLEKRLLLDRLTSQISAQQEEVRELDRLLGQKKEEARRLQELADQRTAGLSQLLQEGKMEAADRRQGIKELRVVLDDLGLQRQEVFSQLAEEKSQLSALKQEAVQEEEKLQKLPSQIHRQKSELKKVLEMQQVEDRELRSLKKQHEQKMADLEKTQGELESERRAAGEVERLTAQARSLQDKVETLSAEKDRLERALTHSKRTLRDTEKSCRAASDTLENLQGAIKGLQSEVTLLRQQRQETITTQQTLQETREELNSLKDQLTDLQDQLRLVEQDLRSSTEQRDDLLREHSALKEQMAASSGRWRVLQADIQDQELRLAQQEEKLKLIRERDLDAASTRVTPQEEERAHRGEGTWCGHLEEALVGSRHLLAESEEQLREKTSQIAVLQKEAESYREQLCAERKRTMVLHDAAANQHLQLERAAEEHKMEASGLRKRLLTVERGAYDNHERATRLLRELQQLQAEHAVLQTQLRSQEDLDKRQQELNEAVKELKAQVKREIQNSLQELHCAAAVDELQEEAEPILDETPSRRSQLESLRENFPFSANCSSVPDKPGAGQGHLTEEQRRGDSLREELRQQEERLKVQLLRRMSRQAEVLSRSRRQTEGKLHSLRRQVDALDELVSSPFLSQNSCGALRSLTAECCSPSIYTGATTSPPGPSCPVTLTLLQPSPP